MNQQDWIWPTEEQLRREVERSRVIARRDLERRRREARREFVRDLVLALAVLAAAFFTIWAIAP
jgi:hypothetical protein